jgi:hypothetical protein
MQELTLYENTEYYNDLLFKNRPIICMENDDCV